MRKLFLRSRRKGSDEPVAVQPLRLYTYGEISEEVKDIVGKRPVWIVRWGSAIFLSIILLFVVIAMFVEFPRRLTNALVIGSVDADVSVKAGSVVRVARLLVRDHQRVGVNEIIGYLDSVTAGFARWPVGRGDSAASEWKRRYVLTAPVAGEVRYVGLKAEGQIVTPGQDLFYIAQPASPLYGEMPIRQTDLKYYRRGDVLDVRIDGVAAGPAGGIAGVVEDVRADPGKPGVFIVRVALPVSASLGEHPELYAGMSARATLIIKKESLLMAMLGRVLPNNQR